MSGTYQIRDEPIGQEGTRFVVEPFWGLLAIMMAGIWLGAVMFAVNAWFLRGPGWQREVAMSVALPLGAGALFVLIAWAGEGGLVPEVGMKYAILAIVLWKITLGYGLYFVQQTSFDLYQYFGGKVHNGVLVVMIGYFLGRPLLARLLEDPLLTAMVS